MADSEGWVTDRYECPIGDVVLTSSWATEKKGVKYEWTTPPSVAEVVVDFPYSYVSGTVFKSAYVCCTIEEWPLSGISYFKINGASGSSHKSRIPVILNNTDGILSVRFTFRANGNKNDVDSHDSTLILKDVHLEITHRPMNAGNAGIDDLWMGLDQNKFPAPPQSVCIINPDTNEVYTFDGVIEVKQQFSSRFDEAPSNYRDEYVNGARNEPDKISLDVMMSDVYTSQTDLTKTIAFGTDENNARKSAETHVTEGDSSSRSSMALEKLYSLKTQRPKLTIITPQHVFLEMVLGTVTVKQDEKTPFGWEAQLDFQHYLILRDPPSSGGGGGGSGSSGSGKKKKTGTGRTQSYLSYFFNIDGKSGPQMGKIVDSPIKKLISKTGGKYDVLH